MEMIRSKLGMGVNKFVGLQAFESAYLAVLAVLPWIVTQPIVYRFILTIAFIIIIHAVFQKLTFKRIDTKDKYVFITGCDSGFGNAVARRLSGEGFKVIAGCYNPEGLGANKLKTEYERIHVLPLDITDNESVLKAFDIVQEQVKGKGIWALINNAAIYGAGDIEFSPLDEYRRLAEVNLFGLVRVTKQFIPLVRASKGRIVNITSSKGRIGIPCNSAFCMTKYGQEGFTDVLRMEMRKFGVKVITVEPGNFTAATDMLSKDKLPSYKKELEKMWNNTSGSVKETYGKQYVARMLKMITEMSSDSSSSIAPIVEAIEMSVIAKNPKQRYLVDGGSGLIDFDNLLIRLGNILPESVIDFFLDRSYNAGTLFGSSKEKND